MKILKLLLTTMLAFINVDICKASCESIAIYVSSQPNFFKLGLSDLKANIKEKLNSPLTYEEEKEFNQKMWNDEVSEKEAKSSLIELLKTYNEIKYDNNHRSWILSDYAHCRARFTAKTFLKKFLDKKFLNDEIFIPDYQLSDITFEPFKEFGFADEEISKIKKNIEFTNEEIEKILFLKNYLVESFSEFIPGFYNDDQSFKSHIDFDLYSWMSWRYIF